MADILSLASGNLTSPIILCFALGLTAALARSDLSVPEAVAKGLSIICIVGENKLDTLLDAAFPILERHIGVVSITDCEVLRAERF